MTLLLGDATACTYAAGQCVPGYILGHVQSLWDPNVLCCVRTVTLRGPGGKDVNVPNWQGTAQAVAHPRSHCKPFIYQEGTGQLAGLAGLPFPPRPALAGKSCVTRRSRQD